MSANRHKGTFRCGRLSISLAQNIRNDMTPATKLEIRQILHVGLIIINLRVSSLPIETAH